MKTFKNKHFTQRLSDCTNVIFCRAEKAPDDNWIECNESEIGECCQLYICAGIQYYGYL